MESNLGPGGYAVLGLLAERPHTAYDLAKQTARRLGEVVRRTPRAIYEEPRRLAARGLATARRERAGGRPRTVYTITSKGRRALAAWLAEPPAPPVLESAGLLRLLFAGDDHREEARAAVVSLRLAAAALESRRLDEARSLLASSGPHPDGTFTAVLVARFLLEHADAMRRWSSWAEAEIANRPPGGRDADAHAERICRENLERFGPAGRS